MVRRVLIALAFVLLVSGTVVGYVWWHAQLKPIGEVYVGMGDVALWDGTGPVRRQLEPLPYGEKLIVLDRYSDWVQVRTSKRRVGWVRQSDLMEPDVWKRLGSLAGEVRAMTVQARGHTAVLSNIRIDPGRTSPRVGQLRENTPVQILGRAVVDHAGEGASRNGGSARPRKDDWLLVRARTRGMGQIAGWVLGDFIEEDPPAALLSDITSAGMQPVAWFELRTVDDPTVGPKPYYLMAGTTGPEGQVCDFTMLRVYTWSIPHKQYETAFVQNGLCGRLPIQVKLESGKQRDVLFRFKNLQHPGPTVLTYLMRDTLVRLLPQPGRW